MGSVTTKRGTRGQLTREDTGIATVAWLVLALPVLIAMMGMGIDFYRVVELHLTLNQRAQIAVIDASNSWAITAEGGAGFEQAQVQAVTQNTYTSLTSFQRSTTTPAALNCPALNIVLTTPSPTTTSPCTGALTLYGLNVEANGYQNLFCDNESNTHTSPKIVLTGTEKVATTFLRTVGITEIKIPIYAEAAIRASNC